MMCWVTLRLTVSLSVLLSSPVWGLWPDIYFEWKLQSCPYGAPSLTRGWVCHLSVIGDSKSLSIYTIFTRPLSISPRHSRLALIYRNIPSLIPPTTQCANWNAHVSAWEADTKRLDSTKSEQLTLLMWTDWNFKNKKSHRDAGEGSTTEVSNRDTPIPSVTNPCLRGSAHAQTLGCNHHTIVSKDPALLNRNRWILFRSVLHCSSSVLWR
jgi:hypothetical protein